jgi:uncharacterized membrane protein YkvA (DUF1232 family)
MIENLKSRARALKTELYVLYYAYRDPRTPWYAKVLVLLVLIYALSPIDLIPDFVPVLGYLDDLIIVPAGIALAIKLIPARVMADARKTSKQVEGGTKRLGLAGAVIIIALWILFLIVITRIIVPFIRIH